MCFVKKFTVTFLFGLPDEVNNRYPASQARFPQFRVIESFCVESSKKRSDLVAL